MNRSFASKQIRLGFCLFVLAACVAVYFIARPSAAQTDENAQNEELVQQVDTGEPADLTAFRRQVGGKITPVIV